MFITISEIDRLINEDVPYIDLTSWSLGIKEQSGKITYFTREDAVVCGTEEVRMVFERLNIEIDQMIPSGQLVRAGSELITGKGRAEDLHRVWKVGQNIIDSCSGIATKTKKMVDVMKVVDPHMVILTTRKGFPGTKKLATKAIMAGGAMPHRLGLSETIVIFKQHMNFIGGFEGLLEKLPELRKESCEKKIIVEATALEQAVALCRAGADGVQFDKLGVAELSEAVMTLRKEFPNCVLLAAGGINETNIATYAKTKVNGIITTSLYNAKPIDIGVKMQ
ncbi:ModD protein [Acetobacterium woodii]|uniref:Putative pyrophosphorylase ModD n=1 Tax=Acetobacterium woodii (strain ATCC 29683 / DSM 1030 / JCM 2381 / KCTC 1655 / WB1) TaxID=931626 RepID=H6LCZ3_ACEWD|nr:ModD protein [Acetobacterium woodii]AFA47832.1 molybdenum utilization protein ModD [Acetobacterium woodii DSM 1030]